MHTESQTKKPMFYSQLLLSKKGPLCNIWLAAHFHKRLKKDQINQTDIPFSVDKILSDEVSVVTQRILGFLLLGVVHIYSKKVEYVFHDCRNLLTRLKDAPPGTKTLSRIENLCSPCPSITLPQSFKLDAFDLGNLENQNLTSDHHSVISHEELLLPDARKDKGFCLSSLDKYNNAENLYLEASSSTFTPVKDVIDLEIDFPECSRNLKVGPDKNVLESTFFLEDRLDPMSLECLESVPGTEEPPPVSTVPEVNEVPPPVSTVPEVNEDPPPVSTVPEVNEQPPPVSTVSEVNEGPPPVSTVPEVNGDPPPVSTVSEVNQEPPPVVTAVSDIEQWGTLTLPLTPQGHSVNASSGPTTPGTKDRTKVSRKRKCIWDEHTILPNKIYKHWIGDSSELVYKRRKAPHTVLHASKAQKISNLPNSFIDPIIPCTFLVNHKVMDLIRDIKVTKSNEPSCSTLNVQVAPPQEEDITKRDPPPRVEQPGTPIKIVEKGPSLSDEQEGNFTFMDEVVNSYAPDNQESENLGVETSERTRAFAGYLYRTFLQKKRQKEDQIISLSEISKGKTKNDSARLFYEILVLKTGSYVDVRQENAYDDIFVVETPSLKQSFEGEK